MHGFFGSYGKSCDWNLSAWQDESFVTRKHDSGSFHLTQVTLPKFLDDKCFLEQDGCFLAIEGVLFESDRPANAIARYRAGETIFWSSWRGSFCGVLYDSRDNRLLVFNDHVGSKMMFYTQQEGGLLFSSDLATLAAAVNSRTCNEQFAWSMLTFGYSPVGETPVKDIQRLLAGEYLLAEGTSAKRHTWHRFDNTPNGHSLQANIEHTERLFRQAVQRVIDKNKQYGLKHVAALSAGLDSRMSVCLARELTDEPIDVVTYSQRGYYDESIPRRIAGAWNLTMHFTPMDGGDYLSRIDETAALSAGLVNYAGGAQVAAGFKGVDKVHTGVVLTGMIGDIVINSRTAGRTLSYPGLGAVSTRYIHHVDRLTTLLTDRFPDQELYYLYVRGFNCADLGSPLILQTFTESYSPFYDVDLLQFCMSVPPAQRYNYRLYDKWIICKHPMAAEWPHNGTIAIGRRPHMVHIAKRDIPLLDLPKRIVWYVCKQLHIHNFYRENAGRSMNPMDDWFNTNAALRNALDSYLNDNLYLLQKNKTLCQSALHLYQSGSVMEKIQVLTLLSALKINQV